MSVVFGIRASSTTSTVTVHSLPFFSIPVTASTGRPISSSTCCVASITTSRGERLLLRELSLLRELDLLLLPPERDLLLLPPERDFDSAILNHPLALDDLTVEDLDVIALQGDGLRGQ